MVKRGEQAADGWGTGTHPLLTASTRLRQTLSDAHGAIDAGSDPAWLSAVDQGRLLKDLGRARHQLDALLMRALARVDRADGIASTDGSRSPADWLTHRLRARPGRLHADANLGAALEARPHLAATLSSGEVTVEHASAVVEVLADLADLPAADLEPEVVVEAERVLVGHCADFTPPQVRRLGRHLLDVVAPDVAEAIEARRLADAERAARRTTVLRLRRTAEGTRRITGEIPELHATILEAALRAIANPRRAGQDRSAQTAEDGQRLTDTRRLGQAFCTLLEHLPVDQLPTHGRSPVTVVVTVSDDKLRAETAEAGIGLLDTGQEISPGELLRIACDQHLRSAILGGPGEVLHLGRDQRFYTRAQRIALGVAHPECQVGGCSVPAAWCDAHHKRRWSEGGPTDLEDGALLCGHHHRLAHDPTYEVRWHDDGTATFHRRC